MKIIPFHEVAPEKWDMLCDHSDEAWLFHRHAWIELEQKHFAGQNYSFAILDTANEVAAILPFYYFESNMERLLAAGMPRQAGLAVRNGLKPSDLRDAQIKTMEQVFMLAEKLDVDRIQLSVSNLAPCNFSQARLTLPFWMLEHNFYFGSHLQPFGMVPAPGMNSCVADQIIDLNPAEQVLFELINKNCRYDIRVAEKNALTFKNQTGSEFVKLYYAIAKRSAARTHEPLPPIDYYADLIKISGETAHIEFLFAYHQNKAIGAIILAIDKDAASYLAGVSDPDYLSMRVNDFMQWSAIKWLKMTGNRWYRLGPYFPQAPKDWPVAKVSWFKSKFGAQSFKIIEGSYFRRPEKYYDSAAKHLKQLCGVSNFYYFEKYYLSAIRRLKRLFNVSHKS